MIISFTMKIDFKELKYDWKYFLQKESAVEMIRNIREAFNELLDENEWMDDETKKLAREKAEAMNERIGYPEILTRLKELDVEYHRVRVFFLQFLIF